MRWPFFGPAPDPAASHIELARRLRMLAPFCPIAVITFFTVLTYAIETRAKISIPKIGYIPSGFRIFNPFNLTTSEFVELVSQPGNFEVKVSDGLPEDLTARIPEIRKSDVWVCLSACMLLSPPPPDSPWCFPILLLSRPTPCTRLCRCRPAS